MFARTSLSLQSAMNVYLEFDIKITIGSFLLIDPLIKTCNVERDITVTLTDSGICPDSEVERCI